MKSYLKLFVVICALTLTAPFLTACSDNQPPPPAPAPEPVRPNS